MVLLLLLLQSGGGVQTEVQIQRGRSRGCITREKGKKKDEERRRRKNWISVSSSFTWLYTYNIYVVVLVVFFISVRQEENGFLRAHNAFKITRRILGTSTMKTKEVGVKNFKAATIYSLNMQDERRETSRPVHACRQSW